MSDKITIEIDGRACEARPGEMIIAVADREGIAIPRFCYHKKLSIAANCRMCLVEAEQGGRPFPKPVPACATPVGDGMKVLTRSPKALDAQRGTMEFLLINHPLDCPICDQGGECELQDVSVGFGSDVSRFNERKRVVADEDIGPLIATEMTRCIHCTRCVRFGAEIAGVRELGALGRGEDMHIATFAEDAVGHELAGNVIDLCPVGALTSKPYRFTARAWELDAIAGISPHDGVGTNLQLHVRGGKVLRVHPRENDEVNETWIADRDRFSYEGLQSTARLSEPLLKERGAWRAVDWQTALHAAAAAMRAAGAEQIGCLVSPTATLEEQFLIQRMVRALGSSNLDSRLRRIDFSDDVGDPVLPWFGASLAEIERQQAVLLVGSDIRQELPLVAHRIRKASLAGAHIALINPYLLRLTHPASQIVAAPGGMAAELASIARALGCTGSGGIGALIEGAVVTEVHQQTAQALAQAGGAGAGIVLFGGLAEAHPQSGVLRGLGHLIAEGAGVKVGFLPSGANATGAWLSGALPHRLPGAALSCTPGLNARAMLEDPRQAYVLWGVDPGLDLGDPALATAALRRANSVVYCGAFRSAVVDESAQVQLPIAAFGETSGTYVNGEVRWQRFQGAVAPVGEARPGWKLLRVLGNMLDLDGFGYESAREVHDELAAICAGLVPSNSGGGQPPQVIDALPQGLTRIGNVPIYAVDALVRHAPALQQTALAEPFGVWLQPDQAMQLGLSEDDEVRLRQPGMDGDTVTGRVMLDDSLAPGTVRVPAGVSGSERLGAQIGPITIEKL